MLQATAAVRPTVIMIWKHFQLETDWYVTEVLVLLRRGLTENSTAFLHQWQPKIKLHCHHLMESKRVNQKRLKRLHSQVRNIVFRSDSWSSTNILASSVDTSLPGSSSEWPWRQRAGADLTLRRVGPSLNFNPRTLLHFKRLVRNMSRLHYEKINCLQR